MPWNKPKKQCPYNEWVYCRDDACSRCGWYPGEKGRKNSDRSDQRGIRKIANTGRKKQINNTSGYPGVYWNKRKGKWHATITKNGKRQHLGYFDSFDDAVKVRSEAERRV